MYYNANDLNSTMTNEEKVKRKLGRPKQLYSPIGLYSWRVIRCQLVDRALTLPRAEQPIRKPRLFGLVSGMTKSEVHKGIHVPSRELCEYLKLFDDLDRPDSGASLKAFYYQRWKPSPKFKKIVVQRVEDTIKDPNTEFPGRITPAAERVANEGILPGSSDPIYLPVSSILAHYFQA